MLSAHLLSAVRAKPGEILVERLEMPAKMGRIALPYTAVELKRSSEAVVAHSGHPAYHPGDVVLLANTVGLHIQFGVTDPRWLWAVKPDQVVARVVEDPGPDGFKLQSVGLLRYLPATVIETLRDPLDGRQLTEGDPEASR